MSDTEQFKRPGKDHAIWTGLAGKEDEFARQHLPIWWVYNGFENGPNTKVAFQADAEEQHKLREAANPSDWCAIAAESKEAAKARYGFARDQSQIQLGTVLGQEMLAEEGFETWDEYARSSESYRPLPLIVTLDEMSRSFYSVDADTPAEASRLFEEDVEHERICTTEQPMAEIIGNDTRYAFYRGEKAYYQNTTDGGLKKPRGYVDGFEPEDFVEPTAKEEIRERLDVIDLPFVTDKDFRHDRDYIFDCEMVDGIQNRREYYLSLYVDVGYKGKGSPAISIAECIVGCPTDTSDLERWMDDSSVDQYALDYMRGQSAELIEAIGEVLPEVKMSFDGGTPTHNDS